MNKAKEMSGFSSEIVADSLNEFGNRLTTFVVVFPRMVLAEFNTHRMLSRNSASSRAIPFKTMLRRVTDTPFIPMKWMKDHKGMQGNEYYTDKEVKDLKLIEDHLEDRDRAIEGAKRKSEKGVTKQICNRLLEPFMWHKVIVTATEWENFFALRAEEGAEIHIQHLAYMMLDAYNASTPKQLKAGEWHIPFGDKMDIDRMLQAGSAMNLLTPPGNPETFDVDQAMAHDLDILGTMIATARCARVSYINYEGKDDYIADIKVHNTLSKVGHMSPFEHCGEAMTENQYGNMFSAGESNYNEEFPMHSLGWSGNFRGFIQYRKTFEGENRTDDRIVKQGVDR